MLRYIKQVDFLLGQHYHDTNESLLCSDPEGINALEIPHIDVQIRVPQQLCHHVLTMRKKLDKNILYLLSH